MDRLRQALPMIWDEKTAHRGVWDAACPSTGQCAVTALLVQELFGGDLRQVDVSGEDHYFGSLDGRVIDLTADQFSTPPDHSKAERVEREDLLANADTRARYELLRHRLNEVLSSDQVGA